jgi:hypothetical protein
MIEESIMKRVTVATEGTRPGFPIDLVCPVGKVGLTLAEARRLAHDLIVAATDTDTAQDGEDEDGRQP